ncbi:hypothetical protein ACROYT_G010832 [Oculina patagonica]
MRRVCCIKMATMKTSDKRRSVNLSSMFLFLSHKKELTNILRLVLSRCRLLGQCFRAVIAERINLESWGCSLYTSPYVLRRSVTPSSMH